MDKYELMMLLKHKTTDGLKVNLALPGQFLIPLVAAMTFLATLMIAGTYAGQNLANRWNTGAASTVILQIPQNNLQISSQNTKQENSDNNASIQQIITLLSTSRELVSFHKLDDNEIDELLAPWLHEDFDNLALAIPAVIELHLKNNTKISGQLETSLHKIEPNIVIEQSNFWGQRLNVLANSLQTCAFLAFLTVIFVAAIVIAIATRTGLIQCKQTIEILHNLGASDHYISIRFARRNAFLSLIGGGIGLIFSIPLLFFLTYLSLPFSSNPNWETVYQGWFSILTLLPFNLLILIIILPLCNYFIGWISTTFIVYYWLRHLT